MKKTAFLFPALVFIGHSKLMSQAPVQPVSYDINMIRETKWMRIQNLVNNYINNGLPGMILLVKEKENVWHTVAGFSDLEKKKSMDLHNQSKVASLTKLFVTVATMKLAEQNKIDIDKPITDFRCGYQFKEIPNAGKITIRHLLSHTSGLPDFIKSTRYLTNLLDRPQNNWKKRDLLRFLTKSKAEFMPGEKGKYCNSNFLLLAIILDSELEDSGGIHNLFRMKFSGLFN